jgi:hypothetical protein
VTGSVHAPLAKLSRAIHHYLNLKALHGGFDHRRRPVSVEVDNDRLRYRFRIGEIEPLPPEWPLVLGDAYHNLRSALDSLAFQLHVRRYRGNVPTNIIDASAFPIRNAEWHYRDGKRKGQPIPTDQWKAISTLAKRERTAIEWLQPYKGFDARHPRPSRRIGQIRSGLADIHRFDIIDKHQQPHLLTAVLLSVYQPQFPESLGFEQTPAFGTALSSNATVDTWSFKHRPPSEMLNIHPGVLTGVGMEPDQGDRIDVLPNLGGSIHIVAMVIARFAKLFPQYEGSPVDLRLSR